MTVPDYFAAFLAGAFLANSVPHFVHGISGNRFPTPFAKPPGKGLSSPTVNVGWALFNMIIGFIIFSDRQIGSKGYPALAAFFVGVAAISFLLSVRMQLKHAE